MKIFHCDHCDQLVFFENVACVRCRRMLAFLPDVADMSSLERAGDDRFESALPATKNRPYRLVRNYSREKVCNWAVPAADPNPFCVACRLNQIIPDLTVPGHRKLWHRLETAKRRLVYTLLELELPVFNKAVDPEHGLGFAFLADAPAPGAQPVHTGHADGVITINIKEADDVEREKNRVTLLEPYRTLIGHFRHEIGHYYWDRLIKDSERLPDFRRRFGDEQRDYGQALNTYYKQGAPADWQQHFVSAYASAHPWEDWAESWAHYLHMADALETAAACGLSLRPRRPDEPVLKPLGNKENGKFDRMIENWCSLTYVLNNLNRGLGQPDGYPFVLSPPAVDKLHFVHEMIRLAARPTRALLAIAG